MSGDQIVTRRDPELMSKAYEEATRRKPNASHSTLYAMAKAIYTEEWKVDETSEQYPR